jgi:hypothetical protein
MGTRLAVAGLTLTVAATFGAACVFAWCWRKPVQWSGSLTGGPS